jgi:hypothetical protein
LYTDASLSDDTKAYSVGIVWQGDETLLVACYPSPLLNLAPLRNTTHASEIIIAPFGWKGTLAVSSTDETTSLGIQSCKPAKCSRSWRRSCLKAFQRQGLDISKEFDWVKIGVDVFEDGVSLRREIEWPRNFCFQLLVTGKNGITESLDLDVAKGMYDPLMEAEDWFLSAKDRDQLAKDQSKIKSQKNPHSIGESDEEEIPHHLQTRYDDPLDAQTVAGIYPTPPDGNKPQILSSGAQPVRPIAKSEALMAPNEKGQNKLVSVPSTIPGNSLETYDHLEDDDLFGDIEGQIYTNNGITEDDFDFFDEPDELDCPPVDPQQSGFSEKLSNIGQNSPPELQIQSSPVNALPENELKEELDLEIMSDEFDESDQPDTLPKVLDDRSNSIMLNEQKPFTSGLTKPKPIVSNLRQLSTYIYLIV